jgi:hypothetical protein
MGGAWWGAVGLSCVGGRLMLHEACGLSRSALGSGFDSSGIGNEVPGVGVTGYAGVVLS